MTVDSKSTVDQIDSYITLEYVLGTIERKGMVVELIALEYEGIFHKGKIVTQGRTDNIILC